MAVGRHSPQITLLCQFGANPHTESQYGIAFQQIAIHRLGTVPHRNFTVKRKVGWSPLSSVCSPRLPQNPLSEGYSPYPLSINPTALPQTLPDINNTNSAMTQHNVPQPNISVKLYSNARGLNTPEKRSQLLLLLQKTKAQIVFLQETHFRSDNIPKLHNSFYPTVYHASNTGSKTKGVTILFS